MIDDEQAGAARSGDPEAMERLRDRTDELELIISSLTIFALFALPGWLFGKIADIYTHLSTSLAIAGLASTTLLAGVSYGLGACFIIQLMARAYWVGLIGLRTVFPDGIDWSRTPGLGPLSRRYYRDILPDLNTVIQKTDRVASSLFAVISMLTLGVLWFGTLLIGVLVVSSAIGARFGLTNAGIGVGSAIVLVVFLGVPLLVYLLDAQLAARVKGLQQSRLFGATVRVLRRVAGLAYPQRLVLPVQLTLQSNTRPVAFIVSVIVAVVVITAVGNLRAAAWTNFTLSDEFVYLDDTALVDGFRSTYYEDMASPLDRLRGWPRISSFNQHGSYVRLFLPYQPLRDNLVADRLCGGAGETPDGVGCLRRLWAVSIDGIAVPTAEFVPAERGDLGMRGLIGLVPLAGFEPGLRRIEVVWNPEAGDDAQLVDDRYSEINRRYVIPIAFAPDFELPLE